ncbi:MAG: diadenylate cyclase CdaA [Candidatus Omnitrophota bacterium]|jgi:diadenylate cyclase
MEILTQYWKIIVEIAFLWYFIYMALFFIQGTRTEQLLKGVVIVVIIFVLAQQLKLDTINWALTRLFPISVIALLIIFQPELRRGLARLGQFGVYKEDLEAIEEISKAVLELSRQKMGAIIAIEREVGLKAYIETGIAVDSKVTEELIYSIFIPRAPLHDGAVIIQRDRIIAAGCLLPLTQEAKGLTKTMGTRHRAAVGLTEETDAICVVVSEETGGISVAMSGKITSNLDKESLAVILKTAFYKQTEAKSLHYKALSRISPKVREKRS